MTLTTVRSTFVLATTLLLPLACADGGAAAAPGTTSTNAAKATNAANAANAASVAPSAQATVHALKCGCAIDAIGKCGNYIEVDGKFVALKAPIPMGPMEFCEKDGLRARADGRMDNGTFVASSFAYEP